MVLTEWELNTIVASLESGGDNIVKEMIADKIRNLQSSSKNKRYTIRSTDWLSEAGKKSKRKTNGKTNEESLI